MCLCAIMSFHSYYNKKNKLRDLWTLLELYFTIFEIRVVHREKFSLDTLLAPNSLEKISGFAVPSTFEFVGRNKLCCLWYSRGRIAADIFRSICGGIFDFRQTSETCHAARVDESRGVLRVIMRVLRVSIARTPCQSFPIATEEILQQVIKHDWYNARPHVYNL